MKFVVDSYHVYIHKVEVEVPNAKSEGEGKEIALLAASNNLRDPSIANVLGTKVEYLEPIENVGKGKKMRYGWEAHKR